MGCWDWQGRRTLRDGGLAYARLAQQNGVVLGTARQNLNHARDLLVTPRNLRQCFESLVSLNTRTCNFVRTLLKMPYALVLF